jgi:hypothetical protein
MNAIDMSGMVCMAQKLMALTFAAKLLFQAVFRFCLCGVNPGGRPIRLPLKG